MNGPFLNPSQNIEDPYFGLKALYGFRRRGNQRRKRFIPASESHFHEQAAGDGAAVGGEGFRLFAEKRETETETEIEMEVSRGNLWSISVCFAVCARIRCKAEVNASIQWV